MRLLYVTEQVPNRDPVQGNGSSLIPYEVIRALPAGPSITLLTFDDGFPVPTEIALRCQDVVLLPLAPLARGLAGTVRTAWSAASTATRERVTPETRRIASKLATQHDVTLIHGGRIAALAHAVETPVVIQTVDPWSAVVAWRAVR